VNWKVNDSPQRLILKSLKPTMTPQFGVRSHAASSVVRVSEWFKFQRQSQKGWLIVWNQEKKIEEFILTLTGTENDGNKTNLIILLHGYYSDELGKRKNWHAGGTWNRKKTAIILKSTRGYLKLLVKRILIQPHLCAGQSASPCFTRAGVNPDQEMG
jgi:hypothetical protein